MPKKRQSDSTTAFLYAHGVRVSPSTLNEMVQEAVDRMRRLQDQPAPLDLTASDIARVRAAYGLV